MIDLIKKIGHFLDIFRRVIINLIFFLILLVIFLMPGQEKMPAIPSKGALILELQGVIVEQKEYQAPFDMMTLSRPTDPLHEILLSKVIHAIQIAADDSRIETIVLRLDGLAGGGFTKISMIGEALNQFKGTGKNIVAYGHNYNQLQYQLASYANEIYLDPMGHVGIEGFANYRLYYSDALDKLKITRHVFRVGQYKSAVEPYLRNSMSEQSKKANKLWLDHLWDAYLAQITTNRNIKRAKIPLTEKAVVRAMQKYKGNTAQLAQQVKLVDRLVDSYQFHQIMIERVGASSDESFHAIDYESYLQQVSEPNYSQQGSIGLIVAKGTIYDGKQPPGQIGGDSLSALLQQARLDSNIKAVVLRIDSPGGSAFASEKIRREIMQLKAVGKPVVASMSSLAASGGYWIAMDTQYIFASPTTLTGSIGVFSVIPTFEKSLKSIGVTSDGVSTNSWAGIDLTRTLSPAVKQVMQLNVEFIYQQFIKHVARSRNLSIKEVKRIAQGRVWDGMTAHKIGLVDALGSLDDAIDKAAELAELPSYKVQLIEQERSTEEALMELFFEEAFSNGPQQSTLLGWLAAELSTYSQSVTPLLKLNDPNHVYLICENCLK